MAYKNSARRRQGGHLLALGSYGSSRQDNYSPRYNKPTNLDSDSNYGVRCDRFPERDSAPPPRNYTRAPRENFQENPGAAFFVGKLNKYLNRTDIYNGLLDMGARYGFYVRKLDMPYGDVRTQQGNKGFCFVHCKTKAQADVMIAMKDVLMCNQMVEIKAYSGRGMYSTASGASSGYLTPIISTENSDNTECHAPKEPMNIISQAKGQDANSDHSSGRKSLMDSEYSDGELTDKNAIVTPDSQVYVPEPAMPVAYDINVAFSPENVQRYVTAQRDIALSRGISDEIFSRQYNAIYAEKYNELLSQDPEEIEAVAQLLAPILLEAPILRHG